MDIDINSLIRSISISVIPLLFAITVHEASHAISAKWLGDDTAYKLGRTSLNPAKHIDPVGTILMPLALWVISAGTFTFGYAKPVPVIYRNLVNSRSAPAMVAFAGPLSNFVMALIWMIMFLASQRFVEPGSFIQLVCKTGVSVNLLLCAFNLLPILPLDGGRVLAGFLPNSINEMMRPLERWGMFIVMFLAFQGQVMQTIITPILRVMYAMLVQLTSPFAMLFGG